jgi:hypothetical protein
VLAATTARDMIIQLLLLHCCELLIHVYACCDCGICCCGAMVNAAQLPAHPCHSRKPLAPTRFPCLLAGVPYYFNAALGITQWTQPGAGPAAAAAAAPAPAFQPSPTFTGARPGYVFKRGPQGQGYYKDDPQQALRETQQVGHQGLLLLLLAASWHASLHGSLCCSMLQHVLSSVRALLPAGGSQFRAYALLVTRVRPLGHVSTGAT